MVNYTGSTEADRLESAIYYDRIKGLIERMQRTGFVVTSGEVEALQFCIDVLVIPDEPEPQTPPQCWTRATGSGTDELTQTWSATQAD